MAAGLDTKAIHKLFDRSTPAGAAMYALYNASENEARSAGNMFSRRNQARAAAAGRRRAALRVPINPVPEPEIKTRSLGPARRGEVWVPKVGRRKRSVHSYGPARPGRRPAHAILGELQNAERDILSQQQMEAARGARKHVPAGLAPLLSSG